MQAVVDRAIILLLRAKGETEESLGLMRLIDEQFLETPFFGIRQMNWHLRNDGHLVNEKRIRRLMRLMGLMPIYPKPNTSRPAKEHKTYPYLLVELKVDRPNQVWCSDITYLPMQRGFLYLVAIMDWHTRKVLAWRISNTRGSAGQGAIEKGAVGRPARASGCALFDDIHALAPGPGPGPPGGCEKFGEPSRRFTAPRVSPARRAIASQAW